MGKGNPNPTAGYQVLRHAAGALGAVVAHPLSRVISAVGAGIVCTGLVALGALIFIGTPVSVLRQRARDYLDERGPSEDEDLERADSAGRLFHRAGSIRSALGLDEEVIVLPPAEPPALEEAWTISDPDDEIVPARRPKPRTVPTADGPYQLPDGPP